MHNKYALIRLDKIRDAGLMKELERVLGEYMHEPTGNGGAALNDFVEFSLPHTEEEFFAIKLKDVNAYHALKAYAANAAIRDEELADDVDELAKRAGPFNPWVKTPD